MLQFHSTYQFLNFYLLFNRICRFLWISFGFHGLRTQAGVTMGVWDIFYEQKKRQRKLPQSEN